MLRLKTTVAACLALSAIGGIIACSSQIAKSGGDAKTSSAPAQPIRLPRGRPVKPTPTPLPSAKEIAKADEPAPAAGRAAESTSLAGSVQIAGGPVAGATVTLYAAGTGVPAQLAQGQDQWRWRVQTRSWPSAARQRALPGRQGRYAEGRRG